MTITRKIILFVIILSIAITLYVQYLAGIPVRDLLGLGKPVAEPQTAHGQISSGTKIPDKPESSSQDGTVVQNNKTAALPVVGDDPNLTTLDFGDLQKILALVDQKQRNTMLDNEESFRNFVKNEAANKSVYAAAHANKIDQKEKNLLIARRGFENILREIYLKQLVASKIPQDFPSEEQVKTYYEKNKDKFILEERFPVWQIFLPISADKSQKEIEILKKQAENIISDISKNRLDFATAAIKYSGHQESKFNGGLMGIVKASDLKPDIQKALMALPPDKISSPVSTDDGLHILKHGPLIAKQELKLDDVRDQIKKLLIKQARNELRQAIYKQAAISFPVAIDDKHIEEWRLKLRAEPELENPNKL